MILLDTNVVLRLVDHKHILHGFAQTAVSALQNRGEIFCIVPQIISPISAAERRLMTPGSSQP